MDCRVQRYFVQGMIDAAMEFVAENGRQDVWDVRFKTTIPSGAESCFFTMNRASPEEKRKWEKYTRALEKKSLNLAKRDTST